MGETWVQILIFYSWFFLTIIFNLTSNHFSEFILNYLLLPKKFVIKSTGSSFYIWMDLFVALRHLNDVGIGLIHWLDHIVS